MKAIKAFGLLASLGGMLIALNLGGSAGCGSSNSSGGGGGGGTVSDDVTTARLVTTIASISTFADPDAAALIASAEQSGLKAQTDPCTVGDTSITCTCEGGGSFTLEFGAGDESTMNFDNCIDAEGGLIDGGITITADASGSATINFNNLTTDFGDCGAFTLNGSETIDGSNHIVLDLSTSGAANVNIDGDLTANTDGTLDGTLSYSGDFTADCFFDNTDVSICPNVAEACGLPVDTVCAGDAYVDSCE